MSKFFLIILIILIIKSVNCSNKTGNYELPLVNKPLQVSLLTVVLATAIVFNGSVILNISKDSLKLRMVHFLLIRHVCIADLIGAFVVLPVPLVAVAKGRWDLSDTLCSLVSTTTASLWTMHLVAVALYRADRVFAVWLPTGRYPLFGVKATHTLLLSTWLIALSGSYLATITFGPTFQPALALCIPNVPLVFFIVVFSGYCTGLLALTTGYVFAFARKRRKKKIRKKRDVAMETEIIISDQVPSREFIGGSQSPAEPHPPDSDRIFQKIRNNNYNKNTPEKLSTLTLEESPESSTESGESSILSNNKNILNYNELLSDDEDFIATKSCSDLTLQPPHPPSVLRNAKSLDFCGENAAGIPRKMNDSKIAEKMLRKRRIQKLKHFKPRGSKSPNATKRALASYAVSVGHLLLYLPAMFVIGLKGTKLPPGVALFCGLVVYCEFIVQPLALLLVSPRLRNEVFSTLKRVFLGGE